MQLRRQVDGSSDIVDGHRAPLPADLCCNVSALSQEVCVALLEQCQLGIAQDLAGDHMTPATKNMAMTTKIPNRKPLKKSSFMLHPAESGWKLGQRPRYGHRERYARREL